MKVLLSRIQRIIKDAKEPTEPCKADEREKQALADMIKKKGPGIMLLLYHKIVIDVVGLRLSSIIYNGLRYVSKMA